MKKRYIMIIAGVLLLAVLVPQAFAAITDAQKAKLDDLNAQILELRKQQVDVYVQAGEITKEEAADVKAQMDTGFTNRAANGNFFGRGIGRGGCGGAGGCGGPCSIGFGNNL